MHAGCKETFRRGCHWHTLCLSVPHRCVLGPRAALVSIPLCLSLRGMIDDPDGTSEMDQLEEGMNKARVLDCFVIRKYLRFISHGTGG